MTTPRSLRTAPRAVLLTVATALALSTAACSGSGVTFTPAGGDAGSGTPGGTASTSAAGADASSSSGRAGTMGHGRDMPTVPAIEVPDITTLTDAAAGVNAAFGDLARPGSGVTVTGARCAPNGRITNASGLTTWNTNGAVTHDGADGSAVNNGDGTGSSDTADHSLVIRPNGSASYSDASGSLEIRADGSGTYSSAAGTTTLDGHGNGTQDSAGGSIVVRANGSGTWSSAEGTLTNNGDGSGSWSSAEGTFTNHGNGTGDLSTAAGDETGIPMDPLPKLAPAGRFPAAPKLKPVGRRCGTLIRLEDRVLFDFDSATLRPQASPVLDAVATAVKQSTGTIQVNGHTDALGTDAYNNDLSRRRAQAVADALTSRGVTATLAVHGYGETQPVAPNTLNGHDNPAGRQLNRRVDLVLPS